MKNSNHPNNQTIQKAHMFANSFTPEFPTLIGSPREVRERLDTLKAELVIGLPLARVDFRQAQLLAQTLQSVVTFCGDGLIEKSGQILRALVDAVLPNAPPEPTLLREAAMIARSRKAVLDEANWLSAAKLAELACLSPTNPSAQPNKWKRERRIFAIHHHGIDYFPSYGLDPMADWRPLKALGSVLNVFDNYKDGWGLAYWFHSANSFLGGRRPQDVLATEPEQVIAAARDEMEGAAHA